MKKARYSIGALAHSPSLVATGAALAHGVVVIKGR